MKKRRGVERQEPHTFSHGMYLFWGFLLDAGLSQCSRVQQAYSTSGPFEFNYGPQDCLQITIAW